MISYLYVIQCGQFPYYKIGHTKDLEKRRETIQNANPFPVCVTISIETDGVQTLEIFLHDKYKSQRLHGEWYILTIEDLEELRGILQTDRTAITWLKTQINLGNLNNVKKQ